MESSLITHPAFNNKKKKHCPDVSDVVDIYSMFYIGYGVIFIGCYSQTKTKVFHNDDDDRAGAKCGREFKGLPEGSVVKP